MRANNILKTAGFVLLFSTGFSQAAWFDNFESTTTATLPDHYNQVDTSTGGRFEVFTTAPTLGSKAIKANANNTLTYKGATFSLPVGKQITTSVMVAQKPSTSNAQVLVQLGFGNQNNDVFNNGTTGSFVSIFSRVVSTNTSTAYNLLSNNKSSFTSGSAESTQQSGFTLSGSGATAVWYLYSMTLQRTDTSTFKSSAFLQSFGTDGTTAGAVVAQFALPITYTNAALAAVADSGLLYAGIRSNGGTTGATALRLDNFSVSDPVTIPEPTALGAASAGLLLLAGRQRKTN